MTAVEQEAFDFDAIDADYQARVELVAGDWLKGDEDAERFLAVLMECRRGPADEISQNDVRVKLTEDTVKGPRIAMHPRRYSALWNACKAAGFIDDHGYDTCTTSTTGNNGKPQKLYRWIGGAL